MMRKYCKMALSFAAAILSFFAFADRASVKAAMKFATGGDVTRFRYTDPSSGVGYTAFVHTFTNTAAAAEFQNMSGKTLPVRLLVVGGGGAGMDGNKGIPSRAVYGGGGGGGGGVTETNALLSVGDVWTIRVGAGGGIPASHSFQTARYEAGASSVSNGVAELVLTPGGGAGGSRISSNVNGVRPTVGAAGGGGSGETDAERAGESGTYTSSTLFPGEIGIANSSGGTGGSKTFGGGGGGAGASGDLKAGGRGLTSDITGEEIVYGSGGGGGGFCRDDFTNKRTGGEGGLNAGFGGTYEVVDTVTNICRATAPVANTGSGGAGGISFGGPGDAYSDFDETYAYGTPGADGVVIIRYDIPDTPCIGGDVVTVTTNGFRVTYIHTFTNTTSAATFKPSIAFDGTSVRMLVVGGGGAGMDGLKGTPTKVVCGGGGGGGGGVTETNALLSAGDVWTIRVGAGGGIPVHGYNKARAEAGASSVSNGVVELVLTPGGGAGGSRPSNSGFSPTVGAAGGGGAGKSSTERSGADGTYTSSTFISEGKVYPSGGNGGETAYGGGGGGAGADGYRATGGMGLASDITGKEVFYGSGGGGGGICRDSSDSFEGSINAGGDGGSNAGFGGTYEVVDTVTNICRATAPVANTGSGGAGGISFGGPGEAYSAFDETYAYGTPGADGVVIIRYEVDLPRHQGLIIVFQ